MKIYLFLLGLFFTTTAFADQVQTANCTEGGGCKFELSDFYSDEFRKEFGRDIQPNETVVYAYDKNGKLIRYISKKTRSQIDKEWGGDGYTQIGLFTSYIQVLKGIWEIINGQPTGSECYGVGNLAATAGRFIQVGKRGETNINFKHPFNPAQLTPGMPMKYVKTGFSTYKGTLDFNMGIKEGSGMIAYYYINILNPKLVDTYYWIEVHVPTKDVCTMKVPITFRWVKKSPDEEDDEFPEDDTFDDFEDDLLPVNPKGNEEDLLPVNPSDDLKPVEPGKKPTTNVPRVDEKTPTQVPRIDDGPKTNVPRIEDKPKTDVPRLEDRPRTSVPRLKD